MKEIQKIQKIQKQENRPETGVMQFGDDWPGVFIRGDNAYGYKIALEGVLRAVLKEDNLKEISFFDVAQLEELILLLSSCQVVKKK